MIGKFSFTLNRLYYLLLQTLNNSELNQLKTDTYQQYIATLYHISSTCTAVKRLRGCKFVSQAIKLFDGR